jgi:hypothetical protein
MIHTDSDGHKSIINADEFQRLMTVKAPAEGSSDQAKIDWARSRERLFQDMMLPLFDHLRTMAQLPKGQAPIRRLAIFQVHHASQHDMPGVYRQAAIVLHLRLHSQALPLGVATMNMLKSSKADSS